jgi:hypothetical protein
MISTLTVVSISHKSATPCPPPPSVFFILRIFAFFLSKNVLPFINHIVSCLLSHSPFALCFWITSLRLLFAHVCISRTSPSFVLASHILSCNSLQLAAFRTDTDRLGSRKHGDEIMSRLNSREFATPRTLTTKPAWGTDSLCSSWYRFPIQCLCRGYGALRDWCTQTTDSTLPGEAVARGRAPLLMSPRSPDEYTHSLLDNSQ